MSRLEDLKEFYNLLETLHKGLGGYRFLKQCNGRLNWPSKGVYFFFENGEDRYQSGTGLRVVRVGTHAVSEGSETTLWNRLSTHKGTTKTGGGNHRGSVFRKLLGYSISTKHPDLHCDSWGDKQSASKQVRINEHSLECAVSDYIGAMPFLWLEIDDKPSADSMRSHIERNSIALLSNWNKDEIIDLASEGWLGKYCHKEDIPKSGLWNSKHVDETYRPEYLNELQHLVHDMLKKENHIL